MLFYFFLLAAAIASTELPIPVLTPTEKQEIQELIAVLAQEAELVTTQSESQQVDTEISLAQTITITNAIEPSMLEYKHWTGKYSPELFTISVNGIEIEQEKTCEIPAHSSSIEIEYTYSFMNGIKTGGRKISYQLNENITQANITFDWSNDWRIILDTGKAIKEIVS